MKGSSPVLKGSNTSNCVAHPTEERLEVQAIADDISSKYVPPHVNIFYCFGGLVFTCFLIQVATGFAMTFYYRPSVVDAFASVEYIMTSVNFGWLIRSIHRWSASMMVRAIRSWIKIITFVIDSIQGEDKVIGQYAKA